MFCEKFDTIEEAQDKYPKEACNSCPNNVFENGMMSCKLIEKTLLGGEDE